MTDYEANDLADYCKQQGIKASPASTVRGFGQVLVVWAERTQRAYILRTATEGWAFVLGWTLYHDEN
jgi:hypothetical protein